MNYADWISVPNLIVYVLVAFRIGGIFIISPLLSNKAVPGKLKLAFVIMLSGLMLPLVPKVSVVDLQLHLPLLILAVIREITIGFVLGFASSAVFAAVQAAGEFFGMQLSFSIATIFDPANEDSAGVITSFYVVIGALIFLYLDGHHLIFKALATSFQVLPLGKEINLKISPSITQMVAHIMVVGMQISAPALVVITILNVIFGVITKVSPQMNIYMNTGFILSPVIGLIILMVSLPLFRVLMTDMTQQLGPDLLKMVHELKGS